MTPVTLDDVLADRLTTAPDGRALAAVVSSLATACRAIAGIVSYGPLHGDLGAIVGDNVQGEAQKVLDRDANDLVVAACRRAPVFAVASEEMEQPFVCDPDAPFLVAIDPLDGSSNIEVNLSIGTIFSVTPRGRGAGDPTSHFLRSGRDQRAAGYVLYGPQTTLVLTFGQGTMMFTLDRRLGAFVLSAERVRVAPTAAEFAINASNHRHWPDAVRRYVDECLAGREGPRGADTNMRWIASLVAECQRILVRGGVFLYPEDARPGYERGRVRVLYEAAPIAWIVEQAGGAAIDGRTPILDIVPTDLHQKTPLIFGSSGEVAKVRDGFPV